MNLFRGIILFAIVLLFGSGVWAQGGKPSPVPLYDDWEIVADSTHIVVGDLVALETKEATPRTPLERRIRLEKVEFLKGASVNSSEKTEGVFQVRVRFDDLASIDQMKGKRVIVFATKTSGYRPGFWLTSLNHKSLYVCLPENYGRVKQEVQNQTDIVSSFAQWKPKVRNLEEVRKQLDAFVKAKDNQAITDKLLSKKKTIVPALILLMEDRRTLAQQLIVVPNDLDNPLMFEAVATYGPTVLLEAVAVLLNRATYKNFGFVFNGAPEEERRRVVDAWRVYLFYNRAEFSKK